MTRQPRFLSLFSGCGGFDLGFQDSGFQSIGAVDVDQTVLDVLQSNTRAPVFCADLSSGRLPHPDLGRCDVLLAGSPCQGFSTIGKRELNDPRNELLLVAGRIAARHKPRIVVIENVPAVVSGKHRTFWEGLRQVLRQAGYRTAEVKCNGTLMGVPQRRTRLVMVAWRSRIEISFDFPHVPGGVVRDAIRGVKGLANHDVAPLLRSSPEYRIAEEVKAGQKLCNVRHGPRAVHTWEIPGVFGPTTKRERHVLEEVLRLRRQNRVRNFGDADPVEARALYRLFGRNVIATLVRKRYLRRVAGGYDLVGTFNGKFRRLSLDEPSHTVDTRFGDPHCFLHPVEHRGLTVREAARIQGFPDGFVFHGSRAAQFRMVGNAVPPPMAKTMAIFLRQAFGL